MNLRVDGENLIAPGQNYRDDVKSPVRLLVIVHTYCTLKSPRRKTFQDMEQTELANSENSLKKFLFNFGRQ